MNGPRWMAVPALAILGVVMSAAWCQDPVRELEKQLDMPIDPPETVGDAVQPGGYLGLAVDLRAPRGDAVLVVAVAEGGPAQRGGLQVDDIIFSVDGLPIHDLDDMDRALARPAGTTLKFQVSRAGVLQSLEVTLGSRPPARAEGEEVAELPEPVAGPAADAELAEVPSRPSLGISVVDITELTRRRFGITVDHGAVISQVRAGYPAARSGLPLGGVIVSVNGQRIGSAQELVQLIQAFRPGEEVEVTYFEGERIGRKKVRLTPTAPPAFPAPGAPAPSGTAADRTDPPLRLGRRQPGERPLLDALERTLGSFLPVPEADSTTSDGEVPPPLPTTPPTPPPPPAPGKQSAPAPAAELTTEPPPPPPPIDPAANELEALRLQIQQLQQQLEQLQRRVDQLERQR